LLVDWLRRLLEQPHLELARNILRAEFDRLVAQADGFRPQGNEI
jgi:hypothetical protein